MQPGLTPTKNLGELSGEVLCFGGPYSNLQATEAMLAEINRRGIPPGNVICTGDVVAYCADPVATVEAIINSGIHVVMGNCEESLGFSSDDCGCGFKEGSECDVLSRQWFTYAGQKLSEKAREWMRSLPRTITFSLEGRRFTVIHGGVSEIGKFVFASTPCAEKKGEFESLTGPASPAIIGGHCGLPFTDLENVPDGYVWHNAGVIGMPANDATPRGWFSTINSNPSGIEFSHHPLDYDWQTASFRMQQESLAQPYADALKTGLWPNMDVLRSEERLLKGQPVTTPYIHHWS